MDSNHGVLLNRFAHKKFKLLNRVFLYAPITSNFHVYEAEKKVLQNAQIQLQKCFRDETRIVLIFFLIKAVLQSDLFSELVFIRTDPI